MGIFIRSSSCMVQCAKRMFSTPATLTSLKTVVSDQKITNYQIFNAIIESDLIINKKLRCSEIMDDNQWATVRKDLLQNYKVTKTTVDSKICDICFHYDRLDEVSRYFKFLERNNYEISLNIIGIYLRTFYLRNKSITPEEEEEICRVYNNMRKQYPLLGGKTCSDCILALSLTKNWEQTLELLDMLKVTTQPGVTIISAIISAAFRNNAVSVGWKVMTESIERIPIEHNVYLEYLNNCKNTVDGSKLQQMIEKMFIFWREFDIKPTEAIIMNYADVYKSFGYTAKDSTISKRGQCSSCSHVLQPTTLSQSDFKVLSTTILSNLIVGKNVFCATSPQELKRYMLFVQTMRPYDVVIDGLNVAYSVRKANESGSLESVLNVVKYFYNAKKRVLVIGRAHMNWWSKETMKALREKSDVFLTKNISQDDPFLLHVTLLSGPQTYFVSRDLMRQHKHKLVNPNLQMIFKRWQLSRQYMFEKQLNQIKLIPPLTFEISAQKFNDDWHIPFTKNENLNLPHEYTAPENWLCLKKRNK